MKWGSVCEARIANLLVGTSVARTRPAIFRSMAAAGPYLVVDKRERQVVPFIETAFRGQARFTEAQINVGDFLICRVEDGRPRILACIERKTHADFASSFADGRYDNRAKMMKMRDETGCQLFFLVEGSLTLKRTSKVARTCTMQSLLSATASMAMASGIHSIFTADGEGTALRLLDLLRAVRNVEPFMHPVDRLAVPAIEGGQDGDLPVPAGLTGTYQRDDDSLCTDIWRKLPGVSHAAARRLVSCCSVRQLVCGDVNPDALRLSTGKPFGGKAQASMRTLLLGDVGLAVKLLGGAPGVSENTAGAILQQARALPGPDLGSPLRALFAAGAARCAEFTLEQKGRRVRVGKKAETLFRLLEHCAGAAPEPAPAPAPTPPPVPAPPIDAEALRLAEFALDDLLP